MCSLVKDIQSEKTIDFCAGNSRGQSSALFNILGLITQEMRLIRLDISKRKKKKLKVLLKDVFVYLSSYTMILKQCTLLVLILRTMNFPTEAQKFITRNLIPRLRSQGLRKN